MECKSEKDFDLVREEVRKWRKRHPMFKHDIERISSIIEYHMTEHSKILVEYRRSKSRLYLEKAENEIKEINRIMSTVGKVELMAILSQE